MIDSAACSLLLDLDVFAQLAELLLPRRRTLSMEQGLNVGMSTLNVNEASP